MDDLARKRWETKCDPNEHPPAMALETALEDIKSGKLKPIHVVVCMAYVAENGSKRCCYFQSGQDTALGSIGLVTKIQNMLVEEE